MPWFLIILSRFIGDLEASFCFRMLSDIIGDKDQVNWEWERDDSAVRLFI